MCSERIENELALFVSFRDGRNDKVVDMNVENEVSLRGEMPVR
jgi:hypothetical protein